MMKKEMMQLISSKEIALDTFELVLKNKHISAHAQPGQFIHIAVPAYTLRRPISIAAVDIKIETITILFKIVGKGTATLASLPTGTMIDVLGPNGNGFPFEDIQPGSTILVVGGGIGVPPLYCLASNLKKQGVHVKAI